MLAAISSKALLAAIILSKTQVGSPLSWTGRASQYLGMIYLIPALLSLRNRSFNVEESLTSFFQASEVRYRDLIETSSDAIISADQEGNILMCNWAAEEMFGYQRDEIVGKSVLETIFPSKKVADKDGNLRELLQKESGITADTIQKLSAQKKDGATFPVTISISPTKIGDGWGSIWVVRDISEQVELNELTQRLWRKQEMERKDVAQALHHQLVQDLNALTLGLANVKQEIPDQMPASINRKLEYIASIVNRVEEQIKGLTWGLRPPMLDELGLVPTLKSYFKYFESKNDIDIHLEAGDFPAGLNPEIGVTLYRVIQEALANSVDHGKAKKATVTLQRRDKNIFLTIQDNGVGFELRELQKKKDTKSKVGILNMRKRVEAFNGDFKIHGKPDKGTKIKIKIPLKEALNLDEEGNR